MIKHSMPTMATQIAAGMLVLAITGCDGCDVTGTSASAPPTPDELAGDWVVDSYAVDEDGCNPSEGVAPYDYLKITAVSGGEEANESSIPHLHLLPCISSETCVEEVAPENELPWSDDQVRAEAVHHTANLTQTGPLETQCRLSTVRTLLLPKNSDLELVRSHYELDLPIEGDEACTSELAGQYHAQMNCTRGERFEFRRPEQEDEPMETS